MNHSIVYFNGEYKPLHEVCISPEDRGFVFADGIYEVIRAYNGHLFKLQEHIDRLNYGASSLKFVRHDFPEIADIANHLLDKNHLMQSDAVIYIQITRGAAPRNHAFPLDDIPLTVYASAKPFTANRKAQQKGVKVIQVPDQRWARCDIKSIALLPNTLASQQAHEACAYEALLIRDGAVMEASRSSFFGVWNQTVITPPKTNYILGSITRQVVLDLCQANSIAHEERSVMIEELTYAEELFLAGTTTEITPITQVDHQPVNQNKPGPITKQLQTLFWEAIQ